MEGHRKVRWGQIMAGRDFKLRVWPAFRGGERALEDSSRED